MTNDHLKRLSFSGSTAIAGTPLTKVDSPLSLITEIMEWRNYFIAIFRDFRIFYWSGDICSVGGPLSIFTPHLKCNYYCVSNSRAAPNLSIQHTLALQSISWHYILVESCHNCLYIRSLKTKYFTKQIIIFCCTNNQK